MGGGAPTVLYDRGGSASRFFYCSKASKRDRGEGNTHATVKSTKLMRYLIRLVTPPGGVILDPFMGSGSTGVAAKRLGFGFLGIEAENDSYTISSRRLEMEAVP
jgi:site-specific DNA-methyltransferase (adenine-specific)